MHHIKHRHTRVQPHNRHRVQAPSVPQRPFAWKNQTRRLTCCVAAAVRWACPWPIVPPAPLSLLLHVLPPLLPAAPAGPCNRQLNSLARSSTHALPYPPTHPPHRACDRARACVIVCVRSCMRDCARATHHILGDLHGASRLVFHGRKQLFLAALRAARHHRAYAHRSPRSTHS